MEKNLVEVESFPVTDSISRDYREFRDRLEGREDRISRFGGIQQEKDIVDTASFSTNNPSQEKTFKPRFFHQLLFDYEDHCRNRAPFVIAAIL
ncbi:hypothetical protein M0804_003940 [Polistes exclamans]|nr:hypothetical protein M0804_003940 [Polistes exclamans]